MIRRLSTYQSICIPCTSVLFLAAASVFLFLLFITQAEQLSVLGEALVRARLDISDLVGVRAEKERFERELVDAGAAPCSCCRCSIRLVRWRMPTYAAC
jgi:hypothetical protein